ncbi:hypothetical protein Mterra_03973 [Calidithermus terrae]|uniref:Uncharacterized protein n=1 Tax=Calidithermus terrae TaxID=1408545 RepID=A0A399DZG2_9DEIN|nr:hypothetical protein Mterra_03973 [Calidithermus terrae]
MLLSGQDLGYDIGDTPFYREVLRAELEAAVSALLDPERIWQAAHEVVQSRFGSRAPWVMERFREEFGALEPGQLLHHLSAQIESVLGSYHAKRFREMATLAERPVAENVEGR